MKYILSNLPEKLGDDEINEMLRTADKVIKLLSFSLPFSTKLTLMIELFIHQDGNGSFSYEEFRTMIGATMSMK